MVSGCSTKTSMKQEKGSILILVVMLMSLLIFIPIGAQLLKTAREQVRHYANADTQALNIAQAGLADAISWFRRQNGGLPVFNAAAPDLAFNPIVASSDTIDATLGLVKTGEMSPISSESKMFYRYEVLKTTDPAGVARIPHTVRDITGERVEGHVNGEGLVWYIESVGYVYAQRDASHPVGVADNYKYGSNLIGRARVATEVRRINVVPSVQAAILISTLNYTAGLNGCALNAGSQVAGGSAYGVAYGGVTAGTAAGWNTTYSARFSGANHILNAQLATDIQSILGLSATELSSLADFNNYADIPSTYPASALIYLPTSATFTASRPLNGGGVLVVNGDLTINANSNTYFSGLILATGNVTFNGGGTISGSLIVGKSLTVVGGTEPAYILYDKSAMDQASKELARYRVSKSTYHMFSAFK